MYLLLLQVWAFILWTTDYIFQYVVSDLYNVKVLPMYSYMYVFGIIKKETPQIVFSFTPYSSHISYFDTRLVSVNDGLSMKRDKAIYTQSPPVAH